MNRPASPAAPPVLPDRPRLSPALQRLWRDRETLQLGRAAGKAVVLAGIDEPVRHTLSLLDGTRDRDGLRADAASAGCPPERTAELLALLAGAGLLEDAAAGLGPLADLPLAERDRLAPDLASLSLVTGGRPQVPFARRAASRVQVVGAGRVGAVVATTLATSGVGVVEPVDDGPARPSDVAPGGLQPGDLGRRRSEAARDRLQEAAPSTRSTPLPPDLVVLAPVGPLDELRAADLVRSGTPHLLAEVREQVGVVGPLVLPGRTACLHCLDLTRTDLDPDWPVLAAQLSMARSGTAAGDTSLTLMVAATAAMHVLNVLDGVHGSMAVGATLEWVLPDWRWRRRTWRPHPDCGCGAAPAR